jgi:3-deoxy-D-manno-octulosonic-acid transferase
MATARNSILIFSIGSLGDTLVALPAYHLIRERHPDSRIVLLTNSAKPKVVGLEGYGLAITGTRPIPKD